MPKIIKFHTWFEQTTLSPYVEPSRLTSLSHGDEQYVFACGHVLWFANQYNPPRSQFSSLRSLCGGTKHWFNPQPMAAGPPPGWVCCKDNTAGLPFQVAGELFAAYSILLAEVSPICWRYYTEVFLWSGSAWREAFAPRAGLGRIDIPSIEQSKPRADALRSTNVWQSKVYSRSFVRNSSEHSRSHVLQKIQDTSSIMHVTKLRGSGRPAMNSRSSLACERLGHQHSALSLTTRIDSCFLLNNIISHLRVGIVTRRNGRHIFVEVLIRVKGLERSPGRGIGICCRHNSSSVKFLLFLRAHRPLLRISSIWSLVTFS